MPKRFATLRDWWVEHYNDLRTLCEPAARVHEDETYQHNGVWPLYKLAFMDVAVDMYSRILESAVKRGRFDAIHYIDLCAGSGVNELTSRADPDRTIKIAGTALLGPRRKRFHFHHLVEPQAPRRRALERRLPLYADEDQYTIYGESAATAIPKIVDVLRRDENPHFLAVGDPEGFTELTIPTLGVLLESGLGDVLYNFQHRMIPRTQAATPNVVDAFYGEVAPAALTPQTATDLFARRMAAFDRTHSLTFDVEAGGPGAYAYKIGWFARETPRGSTFLGGFGDVINKRARGITATDLDAIIFGGQRTFGESGG